MVDKTAAVQAKAYFCSKENQLLVPNTDFGRRKYVNVLTTGSNRAGQKALRELEASTSIDGDTDGEMKKSGTRQWIHPPDALLKGHIAYNVKFLGHVEVDNPKGTEVVREAIRKMKFNKHIKKAEGQKSRKVELTVSIDGVTVQEPKTKAVQHQYPLHRISYCADDKSDKRMFTFIAKEADTPVHNCFVFDSDKCAEEITLTVGQAFDLAYRRFLDSSSKDMDVKKQFLLCQKKVQELTTENLTLKARVALLERLIDPKILTEHENSQQQDPKVNIFDDTGPGPVAMVTKVAKEESPVPPKLPPPVKVQKQPCKEQPTVGRRLENLLMDEPQQKAVTNGTRSVPALAPPPPVPARNNMTSTTSPPPATQRDAFGAEPFTPPSSTAVPRRPSAGQDPFGMGQFSPSTQELDQQIQSVDRELLDLHSGFSKGLSFGTDDFSLQDLDPLSNQ